MYYIISYNMYQMSKFFAQTQLKPQHRLTKPLCVTRLVPVPVPPPVKNQKLPTSRKPLSVNFLYAGLYLPN